LENHIRTLLVLPLEKCSRDVGMKRILSQY
jgi:hypothetical protein